MAYFWWHCGQFFLILLLTFHSLFIFHFLILTPHLLFLWNPGIGKVK